MSISTAKPPRGRKVPATPPEPLPSRRVFEQITDRIRRDLAAGTLRSGDKLPAERELAQQLGVSRSAVREALRSLEIAGVVELKKGVKGGAFILDGNAELVTRSIRDLIALGRISVDSLTEARILVMQMAIRLVCERATEAEIEALEANTRNLAALADAERLSERVPISAEFYRLIGCATRNELLLVVIESLTAILLQMWQRSGVTPLPGLVEARRHLVALIRKRDAEAAAAAMAQHLRHLHEHLLRALGRSLVLGG